MRVKHLWAVIPLPSQLKLAYSRVTLNLPTTVYFILSLALCILQVTLHTWLYTQHQYANQSIEPLALNTSLVNFPIVIQMGEDLVLCKDIPTFVGGPDECVRAHISTSTSASKQVLPAAPRLGVSGPFRNVTLVDPATHVEFTVSQQCVDVLPWVYQSLRATDREDIVFSVYHIWYFGVSLAAILHESIPHLIAALILGSLCAVGSVFRIFNTSGFQNEFKRLVVNGSCNGYDILGDSYFQSRRSEEIAISILNGVALIAAVGLSWHLFKAYGQRSFERVHKRREMSRLYIVLLTTGTCIQVAVHYMVTSIGLFIDQLTLGPLRNMTQYRSAFLTSDIVMLALVVPWMILGWTAARRESKTRYLMFFGITILFMASWAAKFTSRVFRLLMTTWGFFTMASVVPMALILLILPLSLYSWYHLDLGLAEYLKEEEPPHPADRVRWSLAVTSDPEKGCSPISEKGGAVPQVTWVHLPAPFIVKPEPAVQKVARSPSKSSSVSSDESRRSTSSITSSLFTRSRSGSLPPDSYLPPPPGLFPPPPPPKGLPALPASTSPMEPPLGSPLRAPPLNEYLFHPRF